MPHLGSIVYGVSSTRPEESFQVIVAWPIWAGGYPTIEEALEAMARRDDEFAAVVSRAVTAVSSATNVIGHSFGPGKYRPLSGLDPGPRAASNSLLGNVVINPGDPLDAATTNTLANAIGSTTREFAQRHMPGAGTGANLYEVTVTPPGETPAAVVGASSPRATPSASGSARSSWFGPAGVIVAALIGLVGVLISREGPPPPVQCQLPNGPGPRACIDTPRTGESVEREFLVTGKLADVPDDSHVWLATQVGNFYWPKEPEVPIGSVFSVEVSEGGNPPNGRFSLALLVVDDQTQSDIEEWIANGEGLGRPFGDVELLYTVANLRLR